MAIEAGDNLPSVELFIKDADGIRKFTSGQLFGEGRILLFALPGAFTPTCDRSHLPGYVVRSDELYAKGIDRIVCLSVNDPHVMKAWGDMHNADGVVTMVADGNGDFTRAVGLESDRREAGMGIRSQRYAMLIEDGVVKRLDIEAPGKFEVSDADTQLARL